MTVAPLRAAAAAGQASACETRGSPDGRRQEQSFEGLLATLSESRAAPTGLTGQAAEAGSPAERIIALLLAEDGGVAAAAPRTGGAIGNGDLGAAARSVLEAFVDEAAEAASLRGRTVARVFNENGFFTPGAAQRANPAAPDGPSPLPDTPAPPPDAAGESGRTGPGPLNMPVAAPAAAPADAMAARARSSTGADGGMAAYRQAPASNRPASDVPAPRVAGPAQGAVAAARPERSAGGRMKGDPRAEPRKPPVPAGTSDAASANVQVALHGGGADASLVARVRALTPEDKARLRLEIAALLRRHGYGDVTLRLNGSTEPTDRFQGRSPTCR